MYLGGENAIDRSENKKRAKLILGRQNGTRTERRLYLKQKLENDRSTKWNSNIRL